ncbi:MAG TPA: class I SAM-dependent methyltransferase [Rhodanobacteraceae bacterium]|nr:class I SAM-dependent methyltransferase [Rhodanobacteraceae bacterium]
MDVDRKIQLLRRLLGSNPGSDLLDIGCGMGGYLLAGQALGLDVFGIEPSEAHSRAAVEAFGLDVRSCYFRSTDFDRKFDVVMLSHVIEHIYDPSEFLADVVKVLKPGGRLIVITPNCESLAARICGRYWSMYKPLDHVTMLGKRSISRILPSGTSLQRLETSEWPGEFAAHVISAVKSALRPRLGNTSATPAGNSVRQSNLSAATTSALAVASLPLYLAGKMWDKQSCLYAVIVRGESA